MKHILSLILMMTAAFAGCLGDSDDDGGADPVGVDAAPSFNNTRPDSVTALAQVGRLVEFDGESHYPGSAGIWTYGDYVFGSALSNGFYIADISNPENPTLVFRSEPVDASDDEEPVTAYTRDADVVPHPDGRLTLVLATQNDGMHIWDVTDPYNAEFTARVEVDPNHNVAVVPGTELVFNSQSGGEGRSNELMDLSDSSAPEVLGTYGTRGCHDIAFHGSMGDEAFRAYCAGIDRTEIWDLSGLDTNASDFGITLISTIEGTDSPVVGNPAFITNPVRTLHHLAMVNEDASVLIVGDEHNGGGSPGTCFGYLEGVSTPFGALWFYDISDETQPELLSWISPPLEDPQPDANTGNPAAQTPNCTAHFGTIIPGEEKLAMAWYSAGVLLIDFSDPASPVILDQYDPDPVNTWDARVHNGYVFTGDMARGMEVLQLR